MTRIFFTVYLLLFVSNAMGNDKSFYGFKWLDDDETVYVIQNKEYPKAKRFGFDLSYVKSDSTAYQNTSGAVGALTYYFSEDYALDVTYKIYSNSNNRDIESLLNQNSIKPLVRVIDTALLVHFNWIPFYGKLNMLNKILYMDWGIGFGVGQFATKSNYKTFENPAVQFLLQSEDNVGINIRSYFKFYMTRKWNFGVEYHSTGVQAITSSTLNEEIIWFNDVMLTLGYMF
jgi:outer membrane beta-barrel protein